MEFWHIYLIIASVLIGAEIIFPTFFLLPIGLASILTAILSYFVSSFTWQILFFAVVCAILFVTVNRWRKILFNKKGTVSDLGIVGKIGVVVEDCESMQKPGVVKVYADTWTVLWDDKNKFKNIKAGTKVKVLKIVGNKIEIEIVE